MPKRSRSSSASPHDGSSHGDATSQTLSASPVTKYSRTASIEARSMFCTLPPHDTLQLGPDEFDAHYVKEHTNRCTACSANLPSAHMLELHIGEQHDPLVAAQRDKGEKTYRCFVETCDRFCSAPKKRRLHMIDKHHYPRDYDFRVVETGVEPGRTSLLQSARTRCFDDRQDVGRRRGGLGKMVARHARRQSSVDATDLVKSDYTSARKNKKIVFNEEEEDNSEDDSSTEEPMVDKLSAGLGSMQLSLTPRSVQLRKNPSNVSKLSIRSPKQNST